MRLCMWTCVLVAVPSSIWEFVKGVGLLQWHNVADCLPVQFTCICGRDSHSSCFNYEILLFHNILFESISRMLNKMHKSYWSYYFKSWGTSATSRCVTWLTRGVLDFMQRRTGLSARVTACGGGIESGEKKWPVCIKLLRNALKNSLKLWLKCQKNS